MIAQSMLTRERDICCQACHGLYRSEASVLNSRCYRAKHWNRVPRKPRSGCYVFIPFCFPNQLGLSWLNRSSTNHSVLPCRRTSASFYKNDKAVPAVRGNLQLRYCNEQRRALALNKVQQARGDARTINPIRSMATGWSRRGIFFSEHRHSRNSSDPFAVRFREGRSRSGKLG